MEGDEDKEKEDYDNTLRKLMDIKKGTDYNHNTPSTNCTFFLQKNN